MNGYIIFSFFKNNVLFLVVTNFYLNLFRLRRPSSRSARDPGTPPTLTTTRRRPSEFPPPRSVQRSSMISKLEEKTTFARKKLAFKRRSGEREDILF